MSPFSMIILTFGSGASSRAGFGRAGAGRSAGAGRGGAAAFGDLLGAREVRGVHGAVDVYSSSM